MGLFTFPQLDVPTLALSVGVLSGLLAFISLTLAHTNPNKDVGLINWGRSMLCGAATFVLFALAGHLPFFLTFFVSNLFAIALVPFGILAFCELFEVPPPMQRLLGTIVLGMSGVVYTYFFGGSRGVAIFCMSCALALQLFQLAAIIFQNASTTSATLLLTLAQGTVVSVSIMHLGRAYQTMTGDFASVIPTGNSITQVFYYFSITAFLSAVSVALFAMCNEKVRNEIIERLRRVGLTGLFTRTAFFEMEDEIAQLGRTQGYALLMVDVDHFKKVNDTFGHAAGDIVLAHVARVIANSLRLTDIAVRFGGEEFCVLLRGCNESEAASLANRLVREAGQQNVRLPDNLSARFTLSVGYACLQTSADVSQRSETLSAVIRRADQALYQAKANGRNQAIAAVMPNLSGAVAL